LRRLTYGYSAPLYVGWTVTESLEDAMRRTLMVAAVTVAAMLALPAFPASASYQRFSAPVLQTADTVAHPDLLCVPCME
jgi:hypothetical protein